jgi:hypothetical protein
MLNRKQISHIFALSVLMMTLATAAFAKGPTIVVVQSSAEIDVKNDSPFPFDLYFNDQRTTKIAPHAKLTLRVPVGEALLQARFRGAANVPGQEFSFFLKPNQRRKVVLTVPDAQLKVTNPNPFKVRLHIQGEMTRVMAPHSSLKLFGLRPGQTQVSMTAKNQLSTEARLFLRPGKGNRWIPNPWTAKLNIHNPNHKRVRVLVDGQFIGKIKPGATRVFEGIAPGARRITLDAPGKHMDTTRIMVLSPVSISFLQGPKAPKWYKKTYKKKKKKVKVVYLPSENQVTYSAYFSH